MRKNIEKPSVNSDELWQFINQTSKCCASFLVQVMSLTGQNIVRGGGGGGEVRQTG